MMNEMWEKTKVLYEKLQREKKSYVEEALQIQL